MLSEHNPIAELVHQIQQKWTGDVSAHPELKLVRWIIRPEEARLYEGFLRLESTEHGALPEVVVAMLTPFRHSEDYASSLMKEWAKAYQADTKTHEALAAKKESSAWQPEAISEKEGDDGIKAFLAMLSSFRQTAMDPRMNLVVALFPHSVQSMDGFNRWLAS